MKEEAKDEREKRMGKTGKPDWYTYYSIRWPQREGKGSGLKRMHETFAGDGELKEHMTATYWG